MTNKSCGNCVVGLKANTEYPKCSVCSLVLCYKCASMKETTWATTTKAEWKCPLTCNKRAQLEALKAAKEAKEAAEGVKTSASLSSTQPSFSGSAITPPPGVPMDNTQLTLLLKSLQSEVIDMKTSMDFMSSKYDEYVQKVQDLSVSLKSKDEEIATLKTALHTVTQNNVKLTQNLNDFEQYHRRHNVEIHGVQEFEGENLLTVLNTFAAKAELDPISERDIQAVHRLPTRNKVKAKPIIVQFVNKQTRNTWLTARRKKTAKQIRSQDLVGGRNQETIYVNENLTPANRRLLWQARKAGKKSGYDHIWSYEGKVYLRKNKEVSSKPIWIKNVAQLCRQTGVTIEELDAETKVMELESNV